MRVWEYKTTPAELAVALQLDTTKPIPAWIPDWRQDQFAGWWHNIFLVMIFGGRIAVFLAPNDKAMVCLRMSIQAPAPETAEEFREWVQKALVKFRATRERTIPRLTEDLKKAHQELDMAIEAQSMLAEPTKS